MIIDDFYAKAKWLYGSHTVNTCLRACLSDATFSMVLYRAMQASNKYFLGKPLSAVLCKINAVLCGAVIGRGASFGNRFLILHSVGIVINTRVQGGQNIVLESGVVIGEDKRGCPELGNDIFIGSGAKIVGGIRIGNNVTIGANAVVVKDVPDNVVVGGVPARVIRQKTSEEISPCP